MRNPIQDIIEYDQHANGKKLLAQVRNIIANESIVDVDIGWLSECVQTAGSKQFNCKSDVARLIESDAVYEEKGFEINWPPLNI